MSSLDNLNPPTQAELKAARADAARKSRLLNSVESEAKQRAAAAAAAVDARAALEADLSKSKLAAARQAAVVKELHRKLEAAAGVDRDASGDQKRMQAAEEKVRSLSAALKSKEAALKEAKERAEVGASAAEREREKEMEKEREGLEAAVKKWQAEASRR